MKFCPTTQLCESLALSNEHTLIEKWKFTTSLCNLSNVVNEMSPSKISRITWMNFPPYNTFTSIVYTISMASCDYDSTKLATTFQPSKI